MKRISLWSFIVCLLLTIGGCNKSYMEHEYRGILYSDSTLSSPLAGAELSFYEAHDRYDDYIKDGKYVGFAKTDSDGKWAFSYVENYDNPYMIETKLSYYYYLLVAVVYEGELLALVGDTNELMRLYPGCYNRPGGGSTADTTAMPTDSIPMEGGSK